MGGAEDVDPVGKEAIICSSEEQTDVTLNEKLHTDGYDSESILAESNINIDDFWALSVL